ncbi:PEP-CTERM sorting domain-containing protein [Roseovarius bejariae]|nr:PEP-CTERM sorting domain-containing protein [Roseovarius bejariae]
MREIFLLISDSYFYWEDSNLTFKIIATSMVASVVALPALAAPVDLSSWLQDGGGGWNLESDNNGVKQFGNSPPGVFHNNENSQGQSLSGSIEVQSASDNDFVGFVLGYNEGDIGGGNVGQDYLLIDWKQGTQAGWDAGLAISRVTGDIATGGTNTGSSAWQHNGVVEFLTRSNATGSNFGNTGWANNTEYTFDLEFTSSNVKVFVNDNLEIDIDASDYGGDPFADGSFGFYAFSQTGGRYAGLEEADLPPPIPVPAGFPLALSALATLGWLARRRRVN